MQALKVVDNWKSVKIQTIVVSVQQHNKHKYIYMVYVAGNEQNVVDN